MKQMSNEIANKVAEMARVERELNDLGQQDMTILSQMQRNLLSWEDGQAKRQEIQRKAQAIRAQFEDPDGTQAKANQEGEPDHIREAREAAAHAEALKAQREAELAAQEGGEGETTEPAQADDEAFYKELAQAKNPQEIDALMARHNLLK